MSETNYWTRMRRNRISRRGMLSASAKAGVGAAGLALVGCGDDDDDDGPAVAQAQAQAQAQAEPAEQAQAQAEQAVEQAQAEQAAEQVAEQVVEQAEEQAVEQAVSEIVRGGILRYPGPNTTWDYMDPHRGIFGPVQWVMSDYMNYLIRWFNKELGILEADIGSLPEIPDDETYIFAIDQGAHWWDQVPTDGGRDITAADIEFNVQRQIDAVDATGAEDGTFMQSSLYRKTVSTDVIDEQTIVMKTDGPDATYLTSVHAGPFAWMTSPEAAEEFGDRWRDEAVNGDLVSGSGAFIPNSDSWNVETMLDLPRNPDYWKMGVDGAALPYIDGTEQHTITDGTATEAAWRNKQVDAAAFPLSLVQVEGIMADFPETHQSRRSFGFTIGTGAFNYLPEWAGEDGLGNPYLDRRFAMAMQMAVDRFQMIDTVYLGDARPSVNGFTPWFDVAWAPPEDELLQLPGYRVDREQDITELRALIDASGFDTSRSVNLLIPDIWEGTYPGVTETEQAMFENALGFSVTFEVQPYTVITGRLQDGTYPGSGPQWGNPPANLDPTNVWNNTLLPGGSGNWPAFNYDFQPVTDRVTAMQTELDTDARKELATQVTNILTGQDPEFGLDGIQNAWGVMNGIQRVVVHNYAHMPDDVNGANVWQFAHAAHHWEGSWIDTNHPDYPG